MRIAVLGTLDTKGQEIEFLRDQLRANSLETLVVDIGCGGSSLFVADVSREEVFQAAGISPGRLQTLTDRGHAVTLAARGAALVTRKWYERGLIDGIVAIGGSAGTTIATAAMRTLPLGFPKLMLSTVASGQVQPYVGVRDICMMHAVTDLCGLNRISRLILTRAAGAVVGMVQAKVLQVAVDHELVAATMFGVTTPAVTKARTHLEQANYEVLVFHATGTGGRTMEGMITDGSIAGVLDLTTTELADELVGGTLSAGRDRLTAAALKGVPQVISLGALDMVNFGPISTVPTKFDGRRFHVHNPNVTLMRTTPEENDKLGKEIAEKASAAKGSTVILIPQRGVSAIDVEGGPFWWPEANAALFQSIRNWVGPWVRVLEIDCHINDPEFASVAASTLLEMLAKR